MDLATLALVASCALAPAGPVASLELVLNVPATRLDVLEQGAVTHSYLVAVGTREHPTPLGSFQVTRIVWNPWWVPPPFEWAEKERVTPPGPTNPVGRVKLFFATYLFLHGTPLEQSLGTAASHGCARLSNADAIELARLAHRYASPGVAPALLDSLEADTRRTTTIPLATPVPLTIEYRPVEIRGERLEIHPDIYRRIRDLGAEARAMLAAAGWPEEAIDGRRLEEAVRAVVRERRMMSIPLEDLRIHTDS